MPGDFPYIPPAETAPTVKPVRLWRWFIGGFALVFAVLLIWMNQSFYTGDAIVQCKLWELYFMEIRRVVTSSGALGPTTGSGVRALMMLLQHLIVSCVGGLLSLGIGAFVTRSRA